MAHVTAHPVGELVALFVIMTCLVPRYINKLGQTLAQRV
jgi:hypothetical protein